MCPGICVQLPRWKNFWGNKEIICKSRVESLRAFVITCMGLEFAMSQKAVENREKCRKLVLKSSVVPQQPSQLGDRCAEVRITWKLLPSSSLPLILLPVLLHLLLLATEGHWWGWLFNHSDSGSLQAFTISTCNTPTDQDSGGMQVFILSARNTPS